MRERIIFNVMEALKKENYDFIYFGLPTIDFYAEKGERKLIIKVYYDALALKKEIADEIKILSMYLESLPVVVAEKLKEKLKDDIVYERYDLIVLSPRTFEKFLRKEIFVVKKQGRDLIVILNESKFKEKLENASLKEIADKIGVSRSTIVKYKIGKANPSIDTALKLAEIFGFDIFKTVSEYAKEKLNIVKEPEEILAKKLKDLGFNVYEIKRFCANILLKEKEKIGFTYENYYKKYKELLYDLKEKLDVEPIVISNEKKENDFIFIKKEDILRVKSKEELLWELGLNS